MISDQFKSDYRKMTAQGVEFTPEDIVRLNALSVKTRRSSTAARDVYLPRLAFMPRTTLFSVPPVFREPTIAHDLWIEGASRWIPLERGMNFYAVYGFALSRRAENLPDAENPKKVVKAVFRYASKKLSRYTKDQLRAAIEYVLFGADWTACERGPRKSGEATSSSLQNDEPPSPTIGLLTDCRMLRLPISLDEAKRMTSSELTEAINRCWDTIEKKFDPQISHQRAFREYVMAREEIRMKSLSSKAEAEKRERLSSDAEAESGKGLSSEAEAESGIGKSYVSLTPQPQTQPN